MRITPQAVNHRSVAASYFDTCFSFESTAEVRVFQTG